MPTAQLCSFGFLYDRHWMLVDEKGCFMSQRKHPYMAQIKTSLSDEMLVLNAPEKSPLEIPLSPAGLPAVSVDIWGDKGVAALEERKQASLWLSEFLGTKCQLVRIDPENPRAVDPDYSSTDSVSFADGYPLLLISDASVSLLNSKLTAEERVGAERFRANLEVAGARAHQEDSWQQIKIGESVFDVVKPCSRCSIICTDQLSGTRSKEPTHTLLSYREVDDEIMFGQNLINLSKAGKIKVGDKVEVISNKP